MHHLIQQHARRLLVIALVVVLYGWARLPELSEQERARIASRFGFQLPEPTGTSLRTVREVQPSLSRISAWISALGGSVALGDLDGDGLPNDVCYVDTRIDQVIVSAVPGTGWRYSPFTLNPAPLPYDPLTMAPTGYLPGGTHYCLAAQPIKRSSRG